MAYERKSTCTHASTHKNDIAKKTLLQSIKKKTF